MLNPDPVAWIGEHFFIPETGGPITLYPHQQRGLREALALNDDGTFKHSTIIWSDIKKSAKSTITAAVALWRAFHSPWGSILVIANDLKQADSRVAYYLRRAIELNPKLSALCRIRGYRISLPNHAYIEAIPIDPTGEAGSNADMIVFSELWGAHSKAQARMWTEATLSPTKFGKSFRWVETYAGFRGESQLLEQLYEQTVEKGERLDDDLEIFRNGQMFALWNTKPRLPWQTPEYYASEEQILDPSEFLRVHRNQWSAGSAARFLPSMLWWDQNRVDLPVLDAKTPLVCAADAGVVSDNFAFVVVSKHEGKVAVRYARLWEPKGKPLDYAPIKAEIKKFCEQHRVLQVAYDPYQLHSMMQELMQAAVVWTEPFSQAGPRAEADKLLHDSARDGLLVHDGDAQLREHIDNADRKLEGEDKERLRIIKRSKDKKIDLAVALAMCLHRAKNEFGF